MSLVVNEIFYSIQGESLKAGCPCVFIRLTGCNLRCTYCDTVYAFSEGAEMTIQSIIDQIAPFGCSLVEITGGEPLAQDETPALIQNLIKQNYHVLMETNGSLDINRVSRQCLKIVDIKCPSSGEDLNNDFANIDKLAPGDQLKFVISDRKDYDYAKEALISRCRNVEGDHILFSPAHPMLSPADLAHWILEDRLDVRLHLQQHRIIWPHIVRGV